VVLGGGFAIETLVKAPQRVLRTELLARGLTSNINRERALQMQALRGSTFDAPLRTQAENAAARTAAIATQIRHMTGTGSAEMDQLEASLAPFRVALARFGDAMRRNQFDRARTLDRTVVATTFTRLGRSTADLGAALDRAAEGATRSADIEVPLILVGVVLTGSILLVKAVRLRGVSISVAAEQTFRERGEQVRRGLLARTVQAAEDERSRLAAELHDGPVQRLTAVDYLLQRVRTQLRRGDTDQASAISEKAQVTIREEVASLRRIMSDLRPPVLDQRGLVEAIREYAGRLGPAAGIQCTVESRLEDRLAPASETVLYRVAQEALQNVYKHSKARSASISLRQSEDWVRLEVRDDGVGYEVLTGPDADGRQFGLLGMRERVEMVGGRWDVFSRPGHGTRVSATLPKDPAR
jgi:signal transduction histidine kinase